MLLEIDKRVKLPDVWESLDRIGAQAWTPLKQEDGTIVFRAMSPTLRERSAARGLREQLARRNTVLLQTGKTRTGEGIYAVQTKAQYASHLKQVAASAGKEPPP